MRKIAAHYAFTPEGIVENPLVTLDGSRVTAVGSYDPARLDAMAGVEFHAGMLVPALVNAHTHLELSYLRGAIPPGCGYAGFAAGMARVRNGFTDERRRQAAEDADREMFEAGIAVAGDIANDESAFAVKERSRLRYRTFAEVFGLRATSADHVRPLLSHKGTTLTPHSTYSLNDRLFKEICREGDATLSIHFMESPAEQELFEGRGTLHDWISSQGWSCDFLGYGSPARRLTESIPADRSVMLVHCRCVTQRDIDLIDNHFRAPVWWVLCPRSNDYISGALPDVDLLRRNGLGICLGTDSLASNRSLSLVEELRMFPQVPLGESLRWATANGADALGLTDGTGRLAAGNNCGLALLTGFDPVSMTPTPRLAIRRIG